MTKKTVKHHPMTAYESLIHLSRYSRWDEKKGRRERWDETVQRFVDYFGNKYPDSFPATDVYNAIYNREVMPSMRALMTAGPALDRDHCSGYNCSFIPIDHPRAFDEIMYILSCGTGVGFSVESHYVEQLPTIAEEIRDTETVLLVADSRIGWAASLRELVSLLYSGRAPKWDLSKVRPAGSRLVTFGGRASGPEPLGRLFSYLCRVFKSAVGRKLTTLECHDIVCKIADVVIVGGVRRSALISLSDLSDNRMAQAKNGSWWVEHPHRALANNSAVYDEKPAFEGFLNEWKSLYESRSGERGIFNRRAAQEQARDRREKHAGDVKQEREYIRYGTNPCGEIVLRPNQFCNLTEVVIRPDDTAATIKEKVRIATILGTFQSTLTNFRYLRKIWQKNVEEERLLGVSFTGIYDNTFMSTPSKELANFLEEMKAFVIKTNEDLAKVLGIPASKATTCIKPSGTVSQLVGCSSGIHPPYAKYYWRTVRFDNKDPITAYLKANGFKHEPEIHHPDSQTVFYFPQKAVGNYDFIHDYNPLDHLALYEQYKRSWCEHNPSITVSYTDDTFLAVGQWVWDNWEIVIGLSFLPRYDAVYEQAPFIEIDKETFEDAQVKVPEFDVDLFFRFESEDHTSGSQELACAAGVCNF